MFFHSAESCSKQSDSESEEEGSECEPSNHAQPLRNDQLHKMDNILHDFLEQPSGKAA